MNEVAVRVTEVAVTDEQQARFLELVAAEKAVGSVDALRQAGVAGTRGQLRRWLRDNDDLQEQARLARGWNLNRVEAVAWEVAVDKEHPSWDRANARILKAYHWAFRDASHVEHEHSGTVVLEHERRLTIGDVIAARQLAGSGESVGGELPAPREILPAPEDG